MMPDAIAYVSLGVSLAQGHRPELRS